MNYGQSNAGMIEGMIENHQLAIARLLQDVHALNYRDPKLVHLSNSCDLAL